jgi:TPR repeat protein
MFVARPERFELPTPWFGALRSLEHPIRTVALAATPRSADARARRASLRPGGVSLDVAAAFRTLAQQNNREAQWSLAQLYERGEGVLQNFELLEHLIARLGYTV